MAEAARIVRVVGHVAFEIGAGQIVEQHLVTHIEQGHPALAKMREERLAMFQHAVVRTVERVVLHGAHIDVEQVRQRGPLEPFTVQTPFRTRRKQSVDREDAQDRRPVRAFATAPQVLREERIQVEPLPKQVRQPACAPLARTLQTQCAHAQMQSVHLAVQKRQTVFGKQNHLPLSAGALVEHADRLLPRPMLRIAQFAKVEHMAVDRTRAVDAARLHDRPRTVLFPILLADTALQKHAANIEGKETGRPEGRSPLQGFFEMPPLAINGLRVPARQKKAFSAASSGSRVKQAVRSSRPDGLRSSLGWLLPPQAA